MKNIANKKIFTYFFLIITAICSSGFAENVSGKITKGHSNIQYSVDTETGIYSLNFSDAFRFKITVSEQEMNKVSCDKEKEIVKGLAGKLKAKMYAVGRKPVKLSIVDSDLNLDLSQIEKDIKLNLSSRGYKVSNLKSTTKFFIKSLTPTFEWSDKSLTKNAKAELSELTTEIFLNSIRDPDKYEGLHLRGKANMEMPIHTIICDLSTGDLKIYFNAEIEVVNDKKKDPVLSRKQLISLNNDILSNAEILEKANASEDKSFDLGTKKIINSSAALAFSLAKQGFGMDLLKNNYLEFIFYKIFNSSTMIPKKMSESDLNDLENELSDEMRTQDDSIVVDNERLKFEVIK